MLKKKLKIGLIGFGRFGKKYFNNLINSSYFEVEFILKKKQKKVILRQKYLMILNKSII